ncbi:Rpn family recombination-promoting nuclease/putative transposase [Oceanicoccus sagamiensis]|uniref:Transposase (putative) YhgA-like domain-containing protein n=1 Tax=Oceanicoccus sagamiensis TaxID=716816 RepID=A0A1X9NC96_9GAMM|nr:Rpn family recombination-promoting nuclease/putative transposase [Oceanicoccus sagamiensis]ARN73159.1 hypothetical protein BST96_02985 [Oceanicoccus sagamiensis]
MSNSQPPNIHDTFFRAAMKHQRVALDFIRHHCPKEIALALDSQTLKLLPNNYIADDLQETTSDLVFSCKIANKPAYINLLIEHQSSPDKMLPFRVHHYLFGLLYNHHKQHPKKKLPAVYTLVFYHGRQTPYPYSLSLLDGFDDPLGIMHKVLYKPLPLIDANQLSDKELKQQRWIGPMLTAMKYIRQKDMTNNVMDILASLLWNTEKHDEKPLLKLLLNYIFRGGNINVKDVAIRAKTQRITHSVRRDVMTTAEQLEAQGMRKGIEKGKLEGKREGKQESMNEVAIKLLNEGAEIAFVQKITGLSPAEIQALK